MQWQDVAFDGLVLMLGKEIKDGLWAPGIKLMMWEQSFSPASSLMSYLSKATMANTLSHYGLLEIFSWDSWGKKHGLYFSDSKFRRNQLLFVPFVSSILLLFLVSQQWPVSNGFILTAFFIVIWLYNLSKLWSSFFSSEGQNEWLLTHLKKYKNPKIIDGWEERLSSFFVKHLYH